MRSHEVPILLLIEDHQLNVFARLSAEECVMSNQIQPPLSVTPGINSDEHTHLIDQDEGHTSRWLKEEKTWPSQAASYVWARKWHMLFFLVFVSTSVPLLLMARDGIFSPGLLAICSATMLAWVMFQGIERERRRAAEWDERARGQDV